MLLFKIIYKSCFISSLKHRFVLNDVFLELVVVLLALPCTPMTSVHILHWKKRPLSETCSSLLFSLGSSQRWQPKPPFLH